MLFCQKAPLGLIKGSRKATEARRGVNKVCDAKRRSPPLDGDTENVRYKQIIIRNG